MTCAEFQKVLPYIIETGGNAEEEQHLRECQVCADLVADLKYIADQAKLLVPMEEPSPKVWDGIRGSLEREGLVKPARARGRLLEPQSWGLIPWLAILTVLLLIAAGSFVYHRGQIELSSQSQATSGNAGGEVRVEIGDAPADREDEQVLLQVSTNSPAVASSFRDNLKQVNAAIADAKKAVQQNPDDPEARQALMRAHQQKAMLYEMATRSWQ